LQIYRITHHPQAIKFLKILKKLFSKSSLSGVRGNALHLRLKQTAPRRLFGISKPSRKREGLLIHSFETEILRAYNRDPTPAPATVNRGGVSCKCSNFVIIQRFCRYPIILHRQIGTHPSLPSR